MLSPGESSLLAEAVLLQMAAKNPLEVKLLHSRFGPLCGKVTFLVLPSNEKDLMGIDFPASSRVILWGAFTYLSPSNLSHFHLLLEIEM